MTLKILKFFEVGFGVVMFLLMCMYVRNLYVYEMGLGWVLASNAWGREK